VVSARTLSSFVAKPSRQEVPPGFPHDAAEDDNAPIRLVPRLGDELDAGLAHPVVRRLEVVGAQEQPDAARDRQLAHASLVGECGRGCQHAFLLAGWLNLRRALRVPTLARRLFSGALVSHSGVMQRATCHGLRLRSAVNSRGAVKTTA
jgi:hypothetical protein